MLSPLFFIQSMYAIRQSFLCFIFIKYSKMFVVGDEVQKNLLSLTVTNYFLMSANKFKRRYDLLNNTKLKNFARRWMENCWWCVSWCRTMQEKIQCQGKFFMTTIKLEFLCRGESVKKHCRWFELCETYKKRLSRSFIKYRWKK